MNIEDFYVEVGSDAKEVLTRLGGSELLVRKLLGKFEDDKSFKELTEALETGAVQTAFRMAHTLKGVSANLGLGRLFTKASDMTELLRAENIDAAKAAYPELEREYRHTIEALNMLKNE